MQGGFDEWHVYPILDLYQGGHQFPYHLICRLVRREQSIPIHLAQRVGSLPRIHSSKVYFTLPFYQAEYRLLYSCGSCHEPLKAFELEAAAANWPPLPLLDRGNLRKMLLDHLIRFIPCLLQFDSCLPERWISRIPQMLRSQRGPPWILIPTILGGDPPMAKAQKDPYSIFNSLRFLWFFYLDDFVKCESYCKDILYTKLLQYKHVICINREVAVGHS